MCGLKSYKVDGDLPMAETQEGKPSSEGHLHIVRGYTCSALRAAWRHLVMSKLAAGAILWPVSFLKLDTNWFRV